MQLPSFDGPSFDAPSLASPWAPSVLTSELASVGIVPSTNEASLQAVPHVSDESTAQPAAMNVPQPSIAKKPSLTRQD